MISLKKMNLLRSTPSAELSEEYAEFTRQHFSREGIPVVIPARNEEDDLPATLVALADSSVEVNPIVVVNGSEDATFSRAMYMGATALECDRTLKLPSLFMGVEHATEIRGSSEPILFLDADTLVGKDWAGEMRTNTMSDDEKTPKVTWGESIVWHGESRLADIIRNANRLAKSTRGSSIPNGQNMAIHFNGSETTKNDYLALDPQLFIQEEQAIVDIINRNGGVSYANLSMRALTVTRGDRFTLRTLLASRNNLEVRTQLYRQSYGNDFQPYTK